MPDRAQLFGMKIVGSKLFVPISTELGNGFALYTAPIPGGGFAPVTAFPKVNGVGALSYSAGNLLVHSENQFLMSRDGGESFTKLSVEGFSSVTAVAKFADGYLYVLTDGTLYTAAVPQP